MYVEPALEMLEWGERTRGGGYILGLDFKEFSLTVLKNKKSVVGKE